MRTAENSASDKVLEGLINQLDRTKHFTGSIDVVAAVQTYERLVRLLGPRLPGMRRAVGLPVRPRAFASGCAQLRARQRYRGRDVPRDRVFTYWNSGLESAPPLVKACVARIRRFHPSLQVLDGPRVRELVEIPARVATLLEADRPAHFSDYVRTRVLEQYGGIWFDATTWLGRSVDRDLGAKYLRAGTIFPRWTKRSIANWFIASHPRSPLLALQRRALDAWWEVNDDLPDYFLYHRIFEVIQALVPEARGQWNAAPTLSATSAHLLQLEMMQPFRASTLARIEEIAPLQKLSYKYDAVPEGSLLEHLIREDA